MIKPQNQKDTIHISLCQLLAMDPSTLQFTATQDWFSHNIDSWKSLFPLVQSQQPRVLEIGSWEGRSAVFILNTLCANGGEIVCIDHFDLFRTNAGKERFSRMQCNLKSTGKRFRILSEFSFPALAKLLEEEIDARDPGFDWIYIDGSHEADDTFLDSELVWRLAKAGAIVIFDDYHWDKEPENSIHHPRRGIDAFLALHQGQYERLSAENDYQVVLRKTSPMRIGFLTSDKSHTDGTLPDAFSYSINVVLTISTEYAMPAAVAIRSILEQTPSRITIYIVDYGLSQSDREMIRDSIPLHDHSTLLFLSPPTVGLAAQMGVTWAKLDLPQVVPVERVLYLDADVLVRHDLKDLWEIDLSGKSIGAVIDVGHPMGHSGTRRMPYFNAGVMLMDLARIRSSAEQLHAAGTAHANSKYKDQDALNLHFEGDWVALSLAWNAQGLGTYARYPCPERATLNLAEMDDPHIVHFTGPVNPTMGQVLDTYVQPPTAKPWGYIGSPGHPYQHAWWTMLDRTKWSSGEGSSVNSSALEMRRKEARSKAISEGLAEFCKLADALVNEQKESNSKSLTCA